MSIKTKTKLFKLLQAGLFVGGVAFMLLGNWQFAVGVYLFVTSQTMIGGHVIKGGS